MADRKLVGTMDAAREVGVHYGTLSRWATEGRVKPAERTAGKHYRCDVDDLRRQLRDNQERTVLDPLRAAYANVLTVIASMDDLHAGLAILGKVITALQDMLDDATVHRSGVVHRIYQEDALALKPLADRVSISNARSRQGRR